MRGHTLVELLLVLALTGAATASLAPTARRYLDRAAAVAAREALVGLVAEARLAAIETGEARAVVTSEPPTVRVVVGDSTVRAVDLRGEYGVGLELNGGRSEAELSFGPLGLGIMTGQTLRIRRGESVAELVVSGYGRVRRR